jgi:hypothetical protein
MLQVEGGARIFYIPDTKWLIVLPINHILGRVLLMKAFLCGSSLPMIPYQLARFKNLYFKHGNADQNEVEGCGSPLFMLNVHMWQFRRPQPRTISVQERQTRAENWRKEINRKRALRKNYAQERAALRQAMQDARDGTA